MKKKRYLTDDMPDALAIEEPEPETSKDDTNDQGEDSPDSEELLSMKKKKKKKKKKVKDVLSDL